MFAINPEPMYYDWGDSSLVNEFFHFHVAPPLTLAELWMGSHPKGPSRMADPKTGEPLTLSRSLLDLVGLYPEQTLGSQWSTPDGTPGLPFLLKILSARKALSIQAHPSLEQAKEGFTREDEAQIPLSSGSRNYKDANHKPEAIFAVSEFFALRGFREPAKIAGYLAPLGSLIPSVIGELDNPDPAKGLKGFFVRLMDTDPALMFDCFQEMVRTSETLTNQHDSLDPYRWFLELNRDFPGDPGCFGAFYLEIFRLDPGQAMILRAGELHAYLRGIGIEVMANSDNVLRAGCTPKHIDVPELLKVTRFEVNREEPITPKDGEWIDGGFPEFRLLPVRVKAGEYFTLPVSNRPRIVLGLQGQGSIKYQGTNEPTLLSEVPGYTNRGVLGPARAYFLPPSNEEILVTGDSETQGPLFFVLATTGDLPE